MHWAVELDTLQEEVMDPKFDWAARVMRRLGERKALAQIEALVSNLPLTFDDIKRHLEFSPGGYTRNTLFECDAFELKALCWWPGSTSPVHDHHGSLCVFKVIAGAGAEEAFGPVPRARGFVSANGRRILKLGDTVASAGDDVHRVFNPHQDEALVTLHLYAPPLRTMRLYQHVVDGLYRLDDSVPHLIVQ